jgi:hypothetical protein
MGAAATYNTIVVSENPRGRFFDGIISGTPKPGTVMQVKAATEPVGNKWTWEVYNRDADGNRPQGPLAILREDNILGKGITDAYTTGTMGHLYVPMGGDFLLMLLADVTGTTSDSHTIGEILIVDDGTGLLIATTGTPENEPFVCMETLSGLTADTHALVMFSGF